ncbi:hypothetical protein L917_18717 [Phytophthora nicotianae]|uniref:Uncharacterized protein n=1 Tax=Phytophthora nicotianae TaxID=4792 RepID=W2K6S8_PHYNI|nr:hypothetical protein L917_18717 [Phytophthora nicotianae]
MARGEWTNMLHRQLLQLKPSGFAVKANESPVRPGRPRTKRRQQTTHAHMQFDDWVTVSGVQKRRQRASRRKYNGVLKTCFQIWYEDFEVGNAIPESLGKRVVLRRPGKVGRRKKARRELRQEGDAAQDEVDA